MPKHPELTETELFREELKTALSVAVRNHGFQGYTDVAILDYLQGQAKASGITKLSHITAIEILHWEVKHSKTASNPETDGDRAIIRHSVDVLIKTAAEKATTEKRARLTKEDVEYAFSLHFCNVYPFCKGK